MARYAGKGGQVYVASATGSAAGPINGLSKWSIDATADKVDVSAFGDGNKVYVLGLADFKGQISGFWDDIASDTLYQAASSTGGVNVYLYPSITLKPTKYWYGVAWVDYQVSVDVKGAVETNASLAAAGSWGRQ